LYYAVFFNAEDAEIAENGKGWEVEKYF